MTDLNHVALIGRLTRDLGTDANSFAYLPNGTARASVSIAVNCSKKNADGTWADEVSYFDVTIWGKMAESLKPYLTKGKQVAVEGVLKQERWQDRNTGANRSRVVVKALSVQLLGGKSEGDSGGEDFWPQSVPKQPQNGYRQGGQPPRQAQINAPAPNAQPQDFGGEYFPEDIPF